MGGSHKKKKKNAFSPIEKPRFILLKHVNNTYVFYCVELIFWWDGFKKIIDFLQRLSAVKISLACTQFYSARMTDVLMESIAVVWVFDWTDSAFPRLSSLQVGMIIPIFGHHVPDYAAIRQERVVFLFLVVDPLPCVVCFLFVRRVREFFYKRRNMQLISLTIKMFVVYLLYCSD